jgi:CBS domain-containing protein
MKKYAKDIMNKNVISISPDDTLDVAAKKLIDNKISGLPVVSDDLYIVGIVTEKDIIEFAMSGNFFNTPVKDAMITKVVDCDVTTPIEQVSLVLVHNNFKRVPISDKGKLVGVISRGDILKYLYSYFQNN